LALPHRFGKKKRPIKYYSPKRRAVYAQGDKIDHLTLFELHAWTCFICKGDIDRRLRLPSIYAATVEHIIPLSKGGTHTWDNCAPAHYICNQSKGDKVLDTSRQDVLRYA
jgi:5-methylcytosine-specific restriction endonuclease McrA